MEMRRRRGRPESRPEDFRGEQLKVLLTVAESEALDEYCNIHQLKRATACREALLRALREEGLL